MEITILTLFPEIFSPIFNSSIIKRAKNKKLVKINMLNIRNFAKDKHRTVDDKPYGGGVGMLMRVDIVEKAIRASKKNKGKERIILLDPTGKIFNQKRAKQLSKYDHLILVCGHYEGIDFRIKNFIDEKISIGQYILTGGEIPAMAVTDAVIRLLPKVLQKPQAREQESFSDSYLYEAPQFTRPRKYKGFSVPSVLLSGNHKKIKEWLKKSAKKKL